MNMARVSYGTRAGAPTDYPFSQGATFYARRGPREPCASLEDLTKALREDIDDGASSLVPECTTTELYLAPSAVIPLHRPNIGPYANGGEHDLPPEFKVTWTDPSNSDDLVGAISKKPHPITTVQDVLAIEDTRMQSIIQRATSRGIVAALESVDGFKYSFNNAWSAKGEDGQRFSYICQDSMQNKDRHANGFNRTSKHVNGEKEVAVRKPTFDCKGSVSVKCSLRSNCIEVYYRHYAIHPTVMERKPQPRRKPWPRPSSDEVAKITESSLNPTSTDGGLSGTLQAEDAAFTAPPKPQSQPSALNGQRSSNIGKPLKRKRDSDVNVQGNNSNDPLSLSELLKRSTSASSPPAPSPTPSRSMSGAHPAPVAYDLPSWQKPSPAPFAPPQQSSQHFPAPYQPPYMPAKPQQQRPPVARQQAAASKSQPQGQGLFMTLKAMPQDPTITGFIPVEAINAKSSCTNCIIGKKKCDEGRPTCSSCQRSSKFDCVYKGAVDNYSFVPPPASPWSNSIQQSSDPMQALQQTPRPESPDPWFPKR